MPPLEGIRVIELGVMIAVPAATSNLAGFGASVIKVEDTSAGDELRKYGSTRNGMSAWFANANSGKRSISIAVTTACSSIRQDDSSSVGHRVTAGARQGDMTG